MADVLAFGLVMTLVAAAGPAFETLIVNANGVPIAIVGGALAAMPTLASAAAPATVIVTV